MQILRKSDIIKLSAGSADKINTGEYFMKKAVFIAAVAVASCIILTSCGAQSTKAVPNDSTEPIISAQTTDILNTSAAFEDFREAYVGILGKCAADAVSDDMKPCEYTLYDINKDGTPELILKRGTCEADYMFEFYTYTNGKAALLGEYRGDHSGLYALENKNGVYIQFAHMGCESIDIISIKDGKIVSEAYLAEVYREPDEDYTDLAGYLEATPADNTSAILDYTA